MRHGNALSFELAESMHFAANEAQHPISTEEATVAAKAVFHLERAPWWEEVNTGYEFGPGEPFRRENDGEAEEAVERIRLADYGLHHLDGWTYFRDVRWDPTPTPLAVDDVMTTVEDLASLPDYTVLVRDASPIVWQKIGDCLVTAGDDKWRHFANAYAFGPFIIRWIPKGNKNEPV